MYSGSNKRYRVSFVVVVFFQFALIAIPGLVITSHSHSVNQVMRGVIEVVFCCTYSIVFLFVLRN